MKKTVLSFGRWQKFPYRRQRILFFGENIINFLSQQSLLFTATTMEKGERERERERENVMGGSPGELSEELVT